MIPAFNEEARLPRTLRALARHVASCQDVTGRVEVIVVDNASTDATREVALAADSPAMPVRVVTCVVPGKGAAVRAGIAATTADVIGFMDADGATQMEAIDEAWRRLALGADVAIGSRAVAGSDTASRHSWVRDRGARAYRACTARLVPGVADTQCGFKLVRGDLGRAVFAELRSHGFSFDVELLARLQRRGARIDEFPVVWVDVPGSTFDPVRHGAQSFAGLAVIGWRLRSRSATVVTPAFTPLPTIPSAAAAVAADG
ncbi:glycosyltransferase [Nocardioides dongkuii]|uniref:glycosyltransferase n=1 Tax=Nocardioides dongkuii TaxID=2760089 RepID=UPI0015FB0BF9|nr:glycosyltransferase [Nocardioides dongkuii]